MNNNSLSQKIVLTMAVIAFGAFLVFYATGTNVGVILSGTAASTLLLGVIYLGTKSEAEIEAEEEEEEEKNAQSVHVDSLIDQLASRREALESTQKDLTAAEGQLERINEKVLSLEGDNQKLNDENLMLKDDISRLELELDEAKKTIEGQEAKQKDLSMSILPEYVADEERARIVDITNIAEETAEEMRILAQTRDVAIRVVKPDKALLVKADSRLLEILFKNIIDNAIKYMGKTGLFQITISDIGEDLFIVLKDDGEGLDPDETEHIFELNYQGSNRISGNGLGLAQARAIVEYYGGMIYARSNMGNGMGIYIHLPAAGR